MIFDLHNDLPTGFCSLSDACTAANDVSDSVIYAFWTSELAAPLPFIEAGIAALNGTGRYFAVEDLGFADNGAIDRICALPLCYCGLTHNTDNALAGGALGNGDLTARGKRAIARLNAAGIAVDTAHLNRKSFFEVADLADALIDSHTGVDFVCPHPRNLTDDQVLCILERGGIIGLTAVRDFIGGNRLTDYVCLIDRFVQKFGVDGVCIGTDFYGTEPLENLTGYADFYAAERLLSDLGYTDSDIRKIFYQNANQYFTNRRNSQ